MRPLGNAVYVTYLLHTTSEGRAFEEGWVPSPRLLRSEVVVPSHNTQAL